MASAVHCIYCFESLVASLDNQQPLSLGEIEKLYSGFPAEVTSASGLISTASEQSSSSPSTPPSVSSPASGDAASSTTSFASSTAVQPKASLIKQALSKPVSASDSYPLFVTWNTIGRDGDHALRGCIGTFSPMNLDEGLKNYALISAFDDHRFRKITKKELPTLQCAVTLLTDFEPASELYDWDLGTHGIRIKFESGGRRYSGTYLPDVAVEQGWNKEETIQSLMAKSGWSGRKNQWRDVDVNVTRYQGKKFALSYEEYLAFKTGADAQAS